MGTTAVLDRRVHAYRPDLADARLRDKVDAARFADGYGAQISVPLADLKPAPDLRAMTDSQLLKGEPVTVFERSAGWCWVQSRLDGYVGYVQETAIVGEGPVASHWVVAPRTFVYPEPDLKKPPLAALSAGSRLAVTGRCETRGTDYLTLADGGAVIAEHCLEKDRPLSADFVGNALRFVETPYLWGGRSGFGLDCSGLVQIALLLAGRTAPRDSDMQATGLGRKIGAGCDVPGLQRGDLVFWRGHVGIMEDAATLVHTSGRAMRVTREPIAAAMERIGALYGDPTAVRRL